MLLHDLLDFQLNLELLRQQIGGHLGGLLFWVFVVLFELSVVFVVDIGLEAGPFPLSEVSQVFYVLEIGVLLFDVAQHGFKSICEFKLWKCEK